MSMHEYDEATRNQKSYPELILRQTKNLLDQQEESLKESASGQAGNRSTSTGSKKSSEGMTCLSNWHKSIQGSTTSRSIMDIM